MKITYLDLSTFRYNLFSLSYLLILSSSVLIENSTFLRELHELLLVEHMLYQMVR